MHSRRRATLEQHGSAGGRDMARSRGRAGGDRGDGPTPPALPAPEGLDQLPLEELDHDLVLLHWPTPAERPLPRELTAAERAVAQLAIEGLSHEEIARARRRSVATIDRPMPSNRDRRRSGEGNIEREPVGCRRSRR